MGSPLTGIWETGTREAAFSVGIVVASGGVANTKGAWAELEASTG